MYTFPEDAVTSTGNLFWSAPKRFPRPLTFDPQDPSHAAFVQVGCVSYRACAAVHHRAALHRQ